MTRWGCFQALLFILPLPFGGAADWVWPWFAVTAMVLLALDLRERLLFQSVNHLPSLTLPVAFTRALPVLGLLAAVQVWVFFQWLWPTSVSVFETYQSLLKGIGLTSFFALALLNLDSRRRVTRAIWIVVLAAAFQAIFGALMVLTGWELGFFIEKSAYRGLATGTYINRNHLAGYLEMALALGIGLLLAQSTQYRGSFRQRLRQLVRMLLSTKVVLRLLLAIMVIALVLTRSRMGNTAFFASLMITGGLALVLMRNKTLSTTILLSSLLVIDIAIVGTFFGVEKVAERLQNTTSETESRDEVTRDTLQIARDHLLAGIGAGTFIYSYPAYKSDDVTAIQVYNNAHNDHAQFMAEFGLPAFLLLALAVLISAWWAIMAMVKRNSELFKGVGFGACMGIIALLIHSAVDFNLQIPANAYMFVLLLALAAVARWTPHKSEKAPEIRRSRSAHNG